MTDTNKELSLEKSDVFERFYRVIDKHSINQSKHKLILGDFYDIITNLDLLLQKTNEDKNSNPILYETTVKVLTRFVKIFEVIGFQDEPFFYSFKKFLKYLLLVIENSSCVKINSDILENFYTRFPSLGVKIEINPEKEFEVHHNTEDAIKAYQGIEYFKHIFEDINDVANYVILSNDFIGKFYSWDSIGESFKLMKEVYYMNMDIEVGSSKNVSDLTFPFWIFLNSVDSIKGVSSELLSIKKGSLLAKVRIWMNDLVSKEELKSVIHKSKEAAKAQYLEKPVEEVKNIQGIIEKMASETMLIDKQIDSLPTTQESKFINALEIEKKALENEKLRVQIEKEKLDYIEKLSELASKGIIKPDDLRININSILYLLKENGKIITDESTDKDINEIT